MEWIRLNYRGIIFALVVGLCAYCAGQAVPLIGGPVFGIMIGILIGNTTGKPSSTGPGLAFVSKKILQWAIIALGGGLSLQQIYDTGVSSLYVLIFTLSAAFITAYAFGRLLKVPMKLTSLIGMGTAICGGSAISAISPIIGAEERDIAYAISTVFIFNIVAVLTFPALGHIMGFTDAGFGLWAGTAINDTSSVVAAGYSYSGQAGAYATIVKLTRSTMIIPLSLIFAAVVSFKKRGRDEQVSGSGYRPGKIFPWFIAGFVALSLLNTAGILPKGSPRYFTETGKFMIVVALSAIGLNSDIRKMMETGFRPLLLGFVVWMSVAISSVFVQRLTGRM